ncbi:EamA family transporter [Devosia sp.]|uniref:EamA family transporter n=1 Tax=Devosia sp. TaxID=1871048 RepID=UPI003A8ED901
MPLRHILLSFAVATVLGMSFVAVRWGVDEVSPLLMTAARYALAAFPALFFIKRPPVSWRLLATYGLLIGVGQFGLLFLAIKLGMPAGLSSLVIQLQVFFTIGLAFVFFGERPRPWQIIGALVAFGGIAVIALERLEGAALLPLVLTIAAAGFWGFGNMASKRAGRIDMTGFVVWSALFPVLPLVAGAVLLDGPGIFAAAAQNLTWRGLASAAFMAWGATLFGFSMLARLLSLYPASQVSPFMLFVPVAGIASAGLLLGETVTGIEIAGSALVFLGLMINVFGGRLLRRFA